MEKSTIDEYNGPERRAPCEAQCMNHAAHVVKINGLRDHIKAIEDKNPVAWSNFRWAVGIGATLLITLFSIAIGISIDTSRSLRDISIKQEKTIYKIEELQKDVGEIKQLQTVEIDKVHRKLNQYIAPHAGP